MPEKNSVSLFNIINSSISSGRIDIDFINNIDCDKLDDSVKNEFKRLNYIALAIAMDTKEFSSIYLFGDGERVLNKFLLTSIVDGLLFYGYLSKAEEILNILEFEFKIPSDEMRLVLCKSRVNDYIKISNAKSALLSSNTVYEEVILNERLYDGHANIPLHFHEFNKSDLYFKAQVGSVRKFNSDFEWANFKTKKILKNAGFDSSVPEYASDRIFYGRNLRVCGVPINAYAAFDEDGIFQRSRSNRIAKITSRAIAKKVKSRMRFAYVLPFQIAPGNYYHSMAEMIYGLRYIDKVSNDVPIVYSVDKFNLINFFADRMGIDKNRFLSAKECEAICFDEALLIDTCPYYGDKNIFNFFRNFVKNNTVYKKRKIYLSRLLSKRSFENESDLEISLENLGFEIVYAEKMTLEEQIRVFSEASIIVAPHGAGLTNLFFCSENVGLLEIFNKNFINRDFYLRSRHIDARYRCHIYDGNKVNIDSILKLVSDFNLKDQET